MTKRKTGIFKKFTLLILLGVFKISIGLYAKLRFRLINQSGTILPKKGAFLLLGNHSNNFDGVFLQFLCPRFINFVVTDTVFRNKTLGRLLRFVGYIPIRKHTSDSRAIRQILKTVAGGGVIGIFPEGMRNWDGRTESVNNATFRLIQVMRIPVYVARFQGAYLSEPRWADTRRRGRIEVKIQKLFDSDDQPDLLEIQTAVTDALMHDEGTWQLNKRIPFKGKALCQGFERLLFVCPACESLGTMDSSAERIWCVVCSAAYKLDVYGFFHSADGSESVRTASELNDWQQKVMENHLTAKANAGILMTDEGARLYAASSPNAPYSLLSTGSIALHPDCLSVADHNFKTQRMSGISVGFKSYVEFRYGKTDYRINFVEKRVSAYKWSCALTLVKRTRKNSDKESE